MLKTLGDLHARQPPLLHRDIKPANIIRRSDGEFLLVDYGAAGEMEGPDGQQLVGSTGYIPPEQFFGQSVPASDLYGLGATALHALSHVHPSEFPADGLHLRIRRRIAVPPDLEAFLERLLAPDPTERFDDAREAAASLEAGPSNLPIHQPHDDDLTIQRDASSRRIQVDSEMGYPRGLRRFLLIVVGAAGGLLATSPFSWTIVTMAAAASLGGFGLSLATFFPRRDARSAGHFGISWQPATLPTMPPMHRRNAPPLVLAGSRVPVDHRLRCPGANSLTRASTIASGPGLHHSAAVPADESSCLSLRR